MRVQDGGAPQAGARPGHCSPWRWRNRFLSARPAGAEPAAPALSPAQGRQRHRLPRLGLVPMRSSRWGAGMGSGTRGAIAAVGWEGSDAGLAGGVLISLLQSGRSSGGRGGAGGQGGRNPFNTQRSRLGTCSL